MGIYDRDYYRQERPVFSVGAPRSAVGILIVINVAVWVLDFLTPATQVEPLSGVALGRWLSDHLAVSGETLTHPWLWWQFLTYGFVHSPFSFEHILFNMFGLFIFGRDIEWRYGRAEFVRLYVALIVVGGLSWAVVNQIQGGHPNAIVYGASGAVVGTVILFALNFPHRTILLFFIIPVPAWVVGVLIVAGDMYGAINRPGANVAYGVHLAGAAFALVYYRFGWNLGRFVPGGLRLPRLPRRPALRIHRPEHDRRPDLSEEVDRILEKIHREGADSLTRKERQTLETASRQYQRKRQQPQ